MTADSRVQERRFAPQIYHRVVPITEDRQGSLNIGGKGEPVEFAIEMTRFDESQTVDLLAQELVTIVDPTIPIKTARNERTTLGARAPMQIVPVYERSRVLLRLRLIRRAEA